MITQGVIPAGTACPPHLRKTAAFRARPRTVEVVRLSHHSEPKPQHRTEGNVADGVTRLFTEAQTATLFSISRSTLRKMRREHSGPKWVRLGRMVRYTETGLEVYIAGLRASRVSAKGAR